MNARVPLDRAIASATCIPHPRQEPAMSAPAPSPAEQAVIDRFGIFEPEERWEQRVEVAARAIWECHPGAVPWDELSPRTPTRTEYRRLAAAALTADATLAGQRTTDEEGQRATQRAERIVVPDDEIGENSRGDDPW